MKRSDRISRISLRKRKYKVRTSLEKFYGRTGHLTLRGQNQSGILRLPCILANKAEIFTSLAEKSEERSCRSIEVYSAQKATERLQNLYNKLLHSETRCSACSCNTFSYFLSNLYLSDSSRQQPCK